MSLQKFPFVLSLFGSTLLTILNGITIESAVFAGVYKRQFERQSDHTTLPVTNGHYRCVAHAARQPDNNSSNRAND